jgi:hypothetical protein
MQYTQPQPDRLTLDKAFPVIQNIMYHRTPCATRPWALDHNNPLFACPRDLVRPPIFRSASYATTIAMSLFRRAALLLVHSNASCLSSKATEGQPAVSAT